jgi:hypothetical protein
LSTHIDRPGDRWHHPQIRRFNNLPNPTLVDAIFENHPDFAGAYFLATLKSSVRRL